jgi:hypothetical protein
MVKMPSKADVRPVESQLPTRIPVTARRPKSVEYESPETYGRRELLRGLKDLLIPSSR